VNLIKKPFYWCSAHRDVKFTFDFETISLNGSTAWLLEDTDTGNMTFTYTGTLFTDTPEAGGIIYVSSGIYKGYHVILSYETLSGFAFINTETLYTADQTTGNVKLITSHVFEIYKGYESGDLATLLPYTKIAEFRPESNIDGYLVVNVSGYLNKIFDVPNSNDTTTINGHEVYYNLFNQYTVILDGGVIFIGNVLNAAIDMFELYREYINTGRALNGGNLGNHYRSCGVTTEIIINTSADGVGGYVQDGLIYTDGIDDAVPDFLTADFDSAGFKVSI